MWVSLQCGAKTRPPDIVGVVTVRRKSEASGQCGCRYSVALKRGLRTMWVSLQCGAKARPPNNVGVVTVRHYIEASEN